MILELREENFEILSEMEIKQAGAELGQAQPKLEQKLRLLF